MILYVPNVAGLDTLAAALAYAAAGWYVLPVKRGSKHPGSVVGFGWNDQSSREPAVIIAWFAGTDYGIALHCGRSGVVAIDVDAPEKMPLDMREALLASNPPMQATRIGDDLRGHYLYKQPEGRVLGNGTGQLGAGWGDVRGLNGVIIVAPSVHEAPDGQYRWLRTGPLAPLPAALADKLHDASPSEDAASDAEIVAFIAAHTTGSNQHLADAWLATFRKEVGAGESRHGKAISIAAGALKEAAAGLFSAAEFIPALHREFIAAAARPPLGKQGNARIGKIAESEWAGILAWAVAQARAAEVSATLSRLAEHAPGMAPPWVHGAAVPQPAPAAPVLPMPTPVPASTALSVPLGGTVAPVAAPVADEAHAQLVTHETAIQRARRAAKRLLDDEESAAARVDGKGHLTDGATFILDTPARVPMIWGSGGEVAWAEGESLMLVGPPGVGKTTLAGQIIRARLGLGPAEPVLGMGVVVSTGRVLYLAMDRPAQAARALRRLFSPGDRSVLADRLAVWKGPPPEDVARNPATFVEMAQAARAETIVVDSIKDAAVGLTEDDIAAGYNRARQNALAEGVQMLELHHLVKRGANGSKPTTLADVYGSTWLTAGAGSVILLWGAAGDAIVELHHLKQPAEPIGPYKIVHDHDLGISEIWHSADLVALATSAPKGLTAKAAAEAIHDTTKPTEAQVEGARRKLTALVKAGKLERLEGVSDSGRLEMVWTASRLLTPLLTAPPFGGAPHGTSGSSRNPVKPPHESPHGAHGEGLVTHSPPSIRGGMQNAGEAEAELGSRLAEECRSLGGKPAWVNGVLLDALTGRVLLARPEAES